MPALWAENLEAWQVFANTAGALFDSLGNINLANARLACETLGLDWDREMMQKIMTAVSAFLEERGQHNRS